MFMTEVFLVCVTSLSVSEACKKNAVTQFLYKKGTGTIGPIPVFIEVIIIY